MLSENNVLILLLAYFAAMVLFTIFLKREKSKVGFLLANRSIPGWMAAFSIAATWIWAPAMFVASEKAYTQGIVGVFWFIVPNVLTLVIFAFFASWMREKYPEGWTFSDYIRKNFSKRTHSLFLVESFGLQIMSFAVQLLAGAIILHKLTGISFPLVTLILAAIPLVYSLANGIRASIITDYWQMIWMLLVLVIGLPIIISNAGSRTIVDGIGGFTGEFTSLFSGKGLAVTLSFGIPTTIGLLSGTFGDQMFWQRVFSIRKGEVKKAILLGSLIFAVVPVSLALFGFIAAGAGIVIPDTQLSNVGAVIAYAPKWFLYLFLVMILSGLISTVDSIICAVSSISGHDLVERINDHLGKGRIIDIKPVRVARVSMIVVAILAILIANIPGIKILHLFLIYGTLRASVMLPTVFAIIGVKMSERGLFYGLLASMLIGLPIFASGNFAGNTTLIVSGSLFTILASGIISISLPNKIK